MKSSALNRSLKPPSETERRALIQLLADEDPSVYQAIREKLLSFGLPACDWLHPFTLSDDPVIRRRVREVKTHLLRRDADDRFLHYCLHSGEDLNLEEATGLLAQTAYPDINIEAYSALYDDWAGQLKDRIEFESQAEQVLQVLNQFVFVDLGFAGDAHYGISPDASYMSRVVDQRQGNPISLCAIYLFLSRRLCLPIAGIGMPGHFLCRFQSSTREIYLDVYRGGRFLTKGDCIKYLRHTPHGLHEGYLTPVSTRRMLSRMCGNLHQTYTHLERREEAARLQRYLVALAK